MNYDQYSACIKILQKQPGWFGKDDVEAKLECLEKFRLKGTPSDIHALISFLRDDNDVISLRTAEVIASLSDKIKSLNQLYDSLKYVSIALPDLDFYRSKFPIGLSVKILGVASLNHSGYVRQKAVEVLADTKDPQSIPYLIARAGDWVSNVRDAAMLALRKFFDDGNRESFIRQMVAIESLKNISRTDLRQQYELITDYLVEKRLTPESYKKLRITDKTRLLYIKLYIGRHGVDEELVGLMLHDRNFLIRSQTLNYIRNFDEEKQKTVIIKLLNDKSSQVRLSTLYYIKDDAESYYDIILAFVSDPSASIRDLARYLLKPYQLDLRALYKERIESGTSKVGSILGLSEVGAQDDLDILTMLMESPDKKVILACLNGISKVDLQQGKKFALRRISDESNKIRRRCVNILSQSWDPEVMHEMERMYPDANSPLKKSILTLYNSIGGWDVLGFLIRAVSENEQELRDLGWSFLLRWKERALRLFTKPPKDAIDRAKFYYGNTSDTLISVEHIKGLWDDIKYYLRYD